MAEYGCYYDADRAKFLHTGSEKFNLSFPEASLNFYWQGVAHWSW